MKNNLITLWILSLLFIAHTINAQDKATISGTMKDAQTGEIVLGALIYALDAKSGASTNDYGYYALSIPKGKQTIRFSAYGYASQEISINLRKDTVINIKLGVATKELKEVVISAQGAKEQVKKTQMGKIDVSIEQIKRLPVLFGEIDILKTLQLLPGVQAGAEGTTGFYVRGGGADQNLIVLDEATVYNANHLFGLFSVFNGDAVSNVELYKGGYPGKFGGRLSSVVDVKMREGNNQNYKLTGGIGLIASRLTIEGPIQKDKGSFLVSGRRTYFDVFTRAYNKSQEGKKNFTPIPDYFFYDLNAKANYQLSQKDKLFVSGYFGRDVFGFSQSPFNFSFDWGNITTTARWNRIVSPKLFANTTTTFTDYQYNVGNKSNIFSFNIGSSIRDWTAKQDFDWNASVAHTIKFGYGATYHTFGVGRVQVNSSDNSFNFNQANNLFGWDMHAYISDDWEITEKLKANLGFRQSTFNNRDAWYHIPEPRIQARYLLSDNVSVKASATRMSQFVHLVSNSGTSLPTDVWYPTTAGVKPQIADQLALGGTFSLFNGEVSITNELYYKKLYNQVDFKNAARLFFNEKLEEEFVFGRGEAYGNEIMIEKKQGKLTGWIGYTLAYTYRYFDSIQNGERFRPKYDIRNDFKVVASYQLTDRWVLSGTFVYNTGILTTLPVGRTIIQDIENSSVTILPVYDKRNNYRQPAYHRLDIGFVYKLKPKRGESDISFSIYNAYDRRNTFFIYIDQPIPDISNFQVGPIPAAQARQVSLFPILPSITYNFKF